MNTFDIAPFALPNHAPNERCFEQPRDIEQVIVEFTDRAPRSLGLSYLQRHWPASDAREYKPGDDTETSFIHGWSACDDQWNANWKKAATKVARIDARTAGIRFKGLTAEFPKYSNYDVSYRHTLGIRIDTPTDASIRRIRIFTPSATASTRLRVELDAGRRTPVDSIQVSSFNSVSGRITAGSGATAQGRTVKLGKARTRLFHLAVKHMRPPHQCSNDEGHVSFTCDGEMFTISLESLRRQGPIWYSELGIYIADADDPTSFQDYRERIKGARTIAQQVVKRHEQSLAGAYQGQPVPHAEPFIVGCKGATQRFWIEPEGDIVLCPRNRQGKRRPPVALIGPRSDGRYLNKRMARFFFQLNNHRLKARFIDPPPVPAHHLHVEQDNLQIQQTIIAVPLDAPFTSDYLLPDETMIGLVRFTFENTGDTAAVAELPISYTNDAKETNNYLAIDYSLEKLSARGGKILGDYDGKKPLRCTHETTMKPAQCDGDIVFRQRLAPGQGCQCLLKIPYIALHTRSELTKLKRIHFDDVYSRTTDFWREEGRLGAQLQTPDIDLNTLHRSHMAYVGIADWRHPDEPDCISTSVGTSIYPNYANESCMINQELDQRSLHDDARRRLAIWVRYQGTAALLGRFTDHDGVYFGSGGFEVSPAYNQNHGWVMWRLAEHFFITQDKKWLASVADSLIAAADWVTRQRAQTMGKQPNSRGWEHGFLPPGGLEDTTDYAYWSVTNVMTSRGMTWVARALEDLEHPQAGRIREEADAYHADVLCGIETARQHCPLVRLRDGRWVPYYPSRLYRRGRDDGWIREVLEGSVCLILAGLIEADSKQAKWILDDFQDNRYMNPAYGYPIPLFDEKWFDRGGFSMQPNLLAGLLPYLERDEPELYIWMFYNAFASCYRRDVNAIVEHPVGELGWSNRAIPKTSDEANSVMWMRYMLVYANDAGLFLGRAVPRAWFTSGREFSLTDVSTVYGRASLSYLPDLQAGTITATVWLKLHNQPPCTILRFRHPEKKPIRSVTVNGRRIRNYQSKKGDVDLTGITGRVKVVVDYE